MKTVQHDRQHGASACYEAYMFTLSTAWKVYKGRVYGSTKQSARAQVMATLLEQSQLLSESDFTRLHLSRQPSSDLCALDLFAEASWIIMHECDWVQRWGGEVTLEGCLARFLSWLHGDPLYRMRAMRAVRPFIEQRLLALRMWQAPVTRPLEDSALYEMDLPDLVTALCGAAQVLREDIGAREQGVAEALSTVRQCLEALKASIGESFPEYNLEVLRERCRHAPPPVYLCSWLLAYSALVAFQRESTEPNSSFWSARGEGKMALWTIRERIEETWYPFRDALVGWYEAHVAAIESAIGQAMNVLQPLVEASRNPLGEVETTYDLLSLTLSRSMSRQQSGERESQGQRERYAHEN